MGNPSWGKGYHQGFADGAVKGGVIVGAVLVVADVTVRLAPWAYRKFRDRGIAKFDQSHMSEDGDSVDVEESGKDGPIE